MVFLIRWFFAFVLVAVTFNPTEWNYYRWALANYADQMALAVLLGLLLFIGYVICLRATLRSIGAFGVLLVVAVVGAMVWVLYDYGMLSIDNTNMLVWLGILAMSVVLGIGLSWSFVRRAVTGQYDVDDADN